MNRQLRLFVAVIVACGFAHLSRAVEVQFDFGAGADADALPSALLKGAEEAFTLNTQGIEALDRAEYDRALQLFDDALVQLPGYTDAQNNRGVVFFRKGTLYEARGIWETITKADPRYAIAWYNLGTLAFHEKQYAKATEQFETALKLNKQFYEAHIMVGRIALRVGEAPRAVESFRKAFKISEADPDCWSHYAFGLLAVRDTAGAEQVLASHKDHPEALRMLGMVALERKQYSRSADLLRTAVDKGASSELLVNLANALIDNGKAAEARTTLDEYLKRAQNRASVEAWILAAIAARETADMAACRRYLESGRQYYPNDPIVNYNLAQVYFQQKQFAEAEKLWSTLADSLKDPTVSFMRANALWRAGDGAGAERAVREAIAMDGKAEYYDFLGVVHYKRGAVDSALACFRKALAIDPALRSAQLNLALAGKQGPEVKQAIADARRGLTGCTEACADKAFELSILCYHVADYKAAIEALLAVKDAERDERILRHLAIYYRQTHELDRAIAVLEQARSRFVVELRTDLELADILLLAGYYRKAIDVFGGLQEKWEGNKWRLWYQLGYAHMELGELEDAQKYFERSLKAKDNVAARGVLAFVLNRRGQSSQARTLWEQNLKEDPTNASLLINLGLAAEEQGQFNVALEYYRRAAMSQGADKSLNVNVGNALSGLKQYAEAFDAYSQALDSPKRKEAAWNAFLAAQRAGRPEKSRSMADILKREFAGTPFARRAQAELALAAGDTSGAIATFEAIAAERDGSDCAQLARLYASRVQVAKAREALRCIPADSAWHRVRVEAEAYVAFAEGSCDRALELLRSLKDTSVVGQYNISLAMFSCKQYGAVTQLCAQVVPRAKGAERANILRLGGNASLALKDWRKAAQWFEQLAGIASTDALVAYNLAVAYYNLGDTKTCYQHYTKARELNPALKNTDIEKRYQLESTLGTDTSKAVAAVDTLDSLYNAAVAWQEKDSLDRAESIYRRIVVADPARSLAWNNLGAVLVFREMYDSAVACYKRAIEKRHDIPETYANLISLYLSLGNLSEAKRWLIKGRGHNPESELLDGMEQALQDSVAASAKRGRR